ncbi:MAG: BamA/TamA family outer membrane protein [Tannerella sp.]|jgi:outer membrane protein assembly factor BamA|nr:BamA/TamA family outer membrane protein [Tannerella sp.]
MKRFVFKKYVCVCCFATCFLSCRTTKYVGDGQYLLDKIKIYTDNPEVKPSEMKPYLQQHPNYKIFGVLKWPLYLYNWSGDDEGKWLNKQLRRIGEPPVLLDLDMAEQSKVQLSHYLSNRGYINAEIDMSIDTTKRRKAVLEYAVTANEPYRICDYHSAVDDANIDGIIHPTLPRRQFPQSLFRSAPKEYSTFIRDNMLFDRNLLEKERQRLTTLLRNNGYYAFNRDYIGYLADSSFRNKCVDVDLYIKPLALVTDEGEAREVSHHQYYINSVKILTDYDPLDPGSTDDNYLITDSATSRGIKIYYGSGGRSIRPSVLQQSCYITPGRLYNERSIEHTYTSFSSLKSLRYMSIKFDEFELADTFRLDCTILTAQAKKQGVRFDVEGTNSAGDLGFASSMTYQHRNLFKGSELFSAKVHGGYEYLSSTQERGNYWEYAGETSIHFPRFMFPFISYDFRRKMRATTEFKMSYDQQRRPEYHRSIVSGGWIFHWQDRINTLARHTFKLLDINYVFLPYIDRSFKDKLPETTALYNYSDQFVVSMGYIYSFNNYDPLERRHNTYSLRVAVESAGNVMYAMSNLFGAKKDDEGRYKLFGINYSEFLKGDVDFARSLKIDERNSVAFHLGLGAIYPVGNTKEIPFDRRYYAGGANSNRGWSVRSLGPGNMRLTDSTSFINQVGDIRIDANIEYRSKLFWKFELALYVDAGNIWTIHKYDYQPDGSFDFNRFYREIAVSYGLGLRLDFDYFLVRLDSGLKAYNPQASGAERWAIANPNFRDNFAWHFAVGYPF